MKRRLGRAADLSGCKLGKKYGHSMLPTLSALCRAAANIVQFLVSSDYLLPHRYVPITTTALTVFLYAFATTIDKPIITNHFPPRWM